MSEVKCGVGKKTSVILIIVLKEREDGAVYGGGVSNWVRPLSVGAPCYLCLNEPFDMALKGS